MTFSGPSPLGGGHHCIYAGENFPLAKLLNKTMKQYVYDQIPRQKKGKQPKLSVKVSLERTGNAGRITALGAHSLLIP